MKIGNVFFKVNKQVSVVFGWAYVKLDFVNDFDFVKFIWLKLSFKWSDLYLDVFTLKAYLL